jgi:hypothetical protein
LSSYLKGDLRYSVSDAAHTFPFPAGFETNPALAAAGREYYEFRAALMQDLWLGLTEIYNLFHSPDDEALTRLEALYRKRAATGWRTVEAVPTDLSPLTFYATPAAALTAVQRLRALHATMDIAVFTAYGWTDLLPKCTYEFLLDYEYEESESGAEESGGRKKKKPRRYRWPDEVRDEVLDRLLRLNAERAEQERLAAVAAAQPKRGKRVAKVPKKDQKTQLALGLPTLSTGERILPGDLRLSFPQPLLYTTTLVVALLSEAGGSLPWHRLLDAYVLVTDPKQMRRLAPPDEAARVAAWAARWNEQVPPGLLLASVEQLGAGNLMVTNDNEGRVFHLLDGPRRIEVEDVAYDAWLALRVATALAPDALELPERAALTQQVRELVLT